jgi:hypothetical protein
LSKSFPARSFSAATAARDSETLSSIAWIPAFRLYNGYNHLSFR